MSQHAALSQFGLPNAHFGLSPPIPSSSQQSPVELRDLATEATQIFCPKQRVVFIAVDRAILSGALVTDLDLLQAPELQTMQYLIILDASGGIEKSFITNDIQSFSLF